MLKLNRFGCAATDMVVFVFWHRRCRRRLWTVLREYEFLSVENIFVTLGDSVSSTSLNLLVSRIGLGIIIYIGPVGFYFIAPLGNGNFTIHVN